jgi:hypothetical protein
LIAAYRSNPNGSNVNPASGIAQHRGDRLVAATIDWGDGTTTSGRVTGSNGMFTVTGGHSYADEGSFPLGVTITDKRTTRVCR